jgi:hypothetical protein
MAGPLAARPMTTGPMFSGVRGRKELSISLINTPGDTNLKLFTDILRTSLYKNDAQCTFNHIVNSRNSLKVTSGYV